SLGYQSASEIVGRPVLDFIHPVDRGLVVDPPGGEDFDGVTPERREARHVRKDGEAVLLEVGPVQSIDFDGGPALLVAARDVTEHKKIQAQLFLADRMASVGTLA